MSNTKESYATLNERLAAAAAVKRKKSDEPIVEEKDDDVVGDIDLDDVQEATLVVTFKSTQQAAAHGVTLSQHRDGPVSGALRAVADFMPQWSPEKWTFFWGVLLGVTMISLLSVSLLAPSVGRAMRFWYYDRALEMRIAQMSTEISRLEKLAEMHPDATRLYKLAEFIRAGAEEALTGERLPYQSVRDVPDPKSPTGGAEKLVADAQDRIMSMVYTKEEADARFRRKPPKRRINCSDPGVECVSKIKVK